MIDIVVVNWNAGFQLKQCIESVRAFHSGLVGRCIVVDNGSTDGSADFLCGASDIDLVQTGRNLGFAAACNLGAAIGESPFILLLNPDAALLRDSLIRPMRYLLDPVSEDIGIVGVQLIGEDGIVQRSCARFPGAANFIAKSCGITTVFKSLEVGLLEWDHSETRDVPHVIGAFFLVRRVLFDRLEGLDERFFVYLEDLDFSYRASLLGYRSKYLADTQAYHKGSGVSEQVKAKRLFYSLRSRIQYSFKHFSKLSALFVAFAALVLEPMVRLSQLAFCGRWREIGDLMRGYRLLWGWAFRGTR